jgi:hypothetical protein
MPLVTVASKPNGAPAPMTASPTRTSLEAPSTSTGRFAALDAGQRGALPGSAAQAAQRADGHRPVLRPRGSPAPHSATVLQPMLAGSLLVAAVKSALFLAGRRILPMAQTSRLVQTVTGIAQVMALRVIWSR